MPQFSRVLASAPVKATRRRHRRDEPGGTLADAIGLDQQRAADQQHDVVAVEFERRGHAFHLQPARRHRQHGREPAKRRAGARGDVPAHGLAEREAPGAVRKDHRVRAEQPEQRPQQQRVRDARRAAERRMREHRHGNVLPHQLGERGQPEQRRCQQQRAGAGVARLPHLLRHVPRRADGARCVQRAVPGVRGGAVDRALAGVHARRERRVRLVGESVVVLDDVDARGGERVRERGQALDRQALRLERRARQRPRAGAEQPPQARRAEARAGEACEELRRPRDVGELNVCVQRRVAEQHVDELGDVAAGGFRGERDRHVVAAVVARADAGDARDDALRDVRVVDGSERQLDALLQRDRLRHVRDVRRCGRDAVGGGDRFHRRCVPAPMVHRGGPVAAAHPQGCRRPRSCGASTRALPPAPQGERAFVSGHPRRGSRPAAICYRCRRNGSRRPPRCRRMAPTSERRRRPLPLPEGVRQRAGDCWHVHHRLRRGADAVAAKAARAARASPCGGAARARSRGSAAGPLDCDSPS